MTTKTTDLDRFLNAQIHELSERSDEELRSMLRMIERAYSHIRIEQGLREHGESLRRLRTEGD